MNTQYLDEISRILQQVRLTQLPQMEKAARMLAEYVPLADEVYQSVASRLRV